MGGVLLKEVGDGIMRPVEHNFDIGVTRGPGIAQYSLSHLFKEGIDGVTQPIEGGAQRPAPMLLPRSAGVAAAIAVPALDAVRTAPGGVLNDAHFHGWWMLFEKFAIVGQLGLVVLLDTFEGKG